MNPVAPPSPADRFVMALEGLYRAVAARIRAGVMSGVMILLVCGRIRRAEGRLLRLLARFRAGLLPMGEVTREAAFCRATGVRTPSPAWGLPRRFGWLLPLVPCEAANFALQLRGVLAEPEMAALLRASARARAVLKPVCRMLAIEVEVLTPAAVVGVADAVAAGEMAAGESAAGEAGAGGWFGGAPQAAVSAAPDFRFFRDGTPPQGPPLAGRG